jgi:hypothetical protein
MAAYLRIENLRNTYYDPASGLSALPSDNPWEKRYADDGLDDGYDMRPWQIWFYAVDAANHEALKTKVPAAFHDLIDGKEPCPVCGRPLGYRPWLDRDHMVETCPACGHIWLCSTWEEEERSKHWTRWMRAHGEPTSLAEFWAMQADKHEDRYDTRSDAGAVVIPWKGGRS